MSSIKILSALLIVAGIIGTMYGGFVTTNGSREAGLGPLALTIEEKLTVNVAIWTGVASIVLGTAMLDISLLRNKTNYKLNTLRIKRRYGNVSNGAGLDSGIFDGSRTQR